MTTRDNCTYLPLSDRVWLLKTAVEMVEEGLSHLYHDAIEAGVDPDDDNLHETLNAMRADSYGGLLQTMTLNDKGDAKALVRLMRLDQEQEYGNY